MTTTQTKQIISGLIDLGNNLVKTDKVDLNTIITTDRLLLEVYCIDVINSDYTIDQISETYYKHEEHIHDVIEATTLIELYRTA